MNDSFLRLSQALTGETSLDAQRAAELEKRIATYYFDDLAELLAAFEKQDSGADCEKAAWDAIGDKEHLHLLGREIIRIWYTGEFQTPSEDIDPPGSVAHFRDGLLWKVIRAHAPAFTNAGYGAWADHPDNVAGYPINQDPSNQAMPRPAVPPIRRP